MMSNSVRRLTFKCPPEYLLRTALRSQRTKSAARNVCISSRHCSNVSTYKAAVCTELGKPLTLQPLERKQLKKGEVRVGIHHASINFGDLLMIKGQYQEKLTLPFVPGTELAGEVLEVSEGVEHIKPGDAVVGVSQNGGAFAEECVIDNRAIVQLPEGIASREAASLLVSYGTAYVALKHTANIQEGDTVLVTAAAGAVGLATVELASKIFKAKVIGACGGPEKCALIKERGASAAIDYRTESVKDRVKELTGGKGANIIIDAVGGDIFNQCLRSVAFEGKIVVIGFASGDIPKIPSNILLVKSCSVAGLYWGSYSVRKPQVFIESILNVLNYAAEGRIQPHISLESGLHEVNEAMGFLAERKSTGKVVVNVRRH